MSRILILFSFLFLGTVQAQNYTSYFTGNTFDSLATAQGGACMMGGATEHDEAMRWFLNRAGGGDVLVLRTSGSDGYNDYMYTDLGVSVNSVETIVFNNSSAANDTYVLNKILNAEAIWFAGGDQWNYVSYWRNTPIDSAINEGILNRDIVIGGTSAGMAILGNYYFSAENGTVTSAAALANPFDIDVTVDSTAFLNVDYLEEVVTDSHYDDPDRKGRHMTFLARMIEDYGINAKGIACNEYTAVCVAPDGKATVFGDWPTYPETAYFLQTNCEVVSNVPETCTAGAPLNWDQSGQAVKVYIVNGTNVGTNWFDLSDWETGSGGTWENWYVQNGTLVQDASAQINCSGIAVSEMTLLNQTSIFPNPFNNELTFKFKSNSDKEIQIVDVNGKLVKAINSSGQAEVELSLDQLDPGIYAAHIISNDGRSSHQLVKF
jgi:cyanophycinase-like exopeptidase